MKTASRIMMGVAGLLLIFASVLKVYQLLTEPENPDAYIVDTWLFGVIQTPLELGLGIWLVSGLFKKAGWLIAQIGYGVFVGVTIWRFATGQASCGCFGTIHVDPRITLFAMDIPIFLGLAIFHPRKEKLLPPPWPHPVHFIVVAIPTAMILSALVPTLIFNKPSGDSVLTAPKIEGDIPVVAFDPTTITIPGDNEPAENQPFVEKVEPSIAVETAEPTGNQTAESNVVEVEPVKNQNKETQVVEPDKVEPAGSNGTSEVAAIDDPNKTQAQTQTKTVEPVQTTTPVKEAESKPVPVKPLPNEWKVLKKIDIADTIRRGLKITLLYREDCDVCHEAMPMFEEYAGFFGTDKDSVRIAFVELPPYSKVVDRSIIIENTKCLLGKYVPENKDDKVFGSTPIIVITQGGVPVKSWDGKDPIPTFDDLMAVMMGE